MNKNFYITLGGVLSFTFTLSIFLTLYLLSIFHEPKEEYRLTKEVGLEVSLVEIKEDDKKNQLKKVKQEKKEVPKKEPPRMASKTPKESSGVEDLFSSVSVKSTKRTTELAKRKSEAPSRFNKSIASSLAKLDDIDKEEKKKSAKITSTTGKYNEYVSKISTILYRKWNRICPNDENFIGLSSSVLIKIDNSGKIDYEIVSHSGYPYFDEMLREFLNQMRGLTFPTHKEIKSFEIEFDGVEE